MCSWLFSVSDSVEVLGLDVAEDIPDAGAGMVREDTFQPGCRQSPDARPVNFKLSFEFPMMKWD
jgi:hypothetical protein